MKQLLLSLMLLAPLRHAAAQSFATCHWAYSPIYRSLYSCPKDSSRSKPFSPGRFGGFMGLSGIADQRGTRYFGGELSGHYFLTPRLLTGLQASSTVPARISPGPSLEGAEKPTLQLTTVSWRNGLVLTDNDRLRTTLQAGVGLGRATLRDRAQQVPTRDRCDCDSRTEAKTLAAATAPLAEFGLAGAFKLRPDVWLTVQGQYRWWLSPSRFGQPGQLSHYVFSTGVSIPDLPPARRR